MDDDQRVLLREALGQNRELIRAWLTAEDLADSLQAAEGADSYSSQDTDDAAQRLRLEVAAALGAAHEERGLDWPTIAKALFREVPMCTGCDFDHSFDDHVRAVVRDTRAAIPAPSTEERG